MPSIEELLNEAESHMAAQPVNDVLEINPETREISIPDSEIILGVETDQKAERKYFHCPKIVGNNIDLSALELYVVFQNASNKEEGKDRYHVTDVKTTSDGYITFSWELSEKVTAYKGDVQFVVCAIKTDSSGVKQNVWNTTIAIGKCLIGLSSDMSESEEQSASDLYTQLISELNSTASAKLAEVTTQIQAVGNNQVSNVNSAGTTQVNNVQNKGTEVLASIPDTYAELDASVKQLNEQIRGKAPVITESTTIQSGSPTTVTDSAEMPLQGLRLYGKSKQVATTGKNLCSIKSCQLSTNLVTSDIVPWTKSSQIYYAFDTQNISGAQAYISIKYHDADKKIVGSNGNTTDCDGTRKTGSFNGKYANSGSDIDLTTIEYISVQLGLYRDSATPSFIDNIMVSDDKNAPYEPYTGGKPSPSPEYPQEIVSAGEKGSIGVEITGKNLFDLSKEYTNDTVVNTFTFTLKPSTKYTLSTDFPATDFPATVNVASIYFGGSSSNINGVWKDRPKTFATDSSGNITVKIRTLEQDNAPAIFNDVLNGVYHIQLEEGNTATSYEPYKTPRTATIPISNGLPGIPVTAGGNYTDENGQQYICDEIDFSRGKYVQRVWQAEFDGSEDEVWTTANNEKPFRIEKVMPEDMYYRTGFCNQYKSVSLFTDTGIVFGVHNATICMSDSGFYDKTLPDRGLSKWKAYLAERPLKVMTYLDTPIETDLTEAQIQAYKSLTTFKPTSIISNDANAQMNVEYACDTKTWVTNKINTLIKEATTS
jgi:hypothetical protein